MQFCPDSKTTLLSSQTNSTSKYKRNQNAPSTVYSCCRVSASRGLDLSRLTVAELTTKPAITRGTTPQPQPESQPEPKSEPEPEPTSEPEPEIEPTSEPESEPTSEPEIEPKSETEIEPTSKPEPEQGQEDDGDLDVVGVTVSSPLLAALAPRLPKPLEGEDRVEVLEVSRDILEKETLNVISSVQRLVEEVRKAEGVTENDDSGTGTTVPTVLEGDLEEEVEGEEVDLEDELFALRYQWSEMLGNSAEENSPDEMAQLVPGACVTDSKGLYDKMQHTVITPKGKERRVDIE